MDRLLALNRVHPLRLHRSARWTLALSLLIAECLLTPKPVGAQSTKEQHYLDLAKEAAEQPGWAPGWPRPTRFVISAYGLWGDQASTQAKADLEAQAKALQLLGFNTVDAKRWNIDLVEIDAILRVQGLRRVQHGNAAPITTAPVGTLSIGPSPPFTVPSVVNRFLGRVCPGSNQATPFDFQASDSAIACWAQNMYAKAFEGSAATGPDLALIGLFDELGVLFCLEAHECKEGPSTPERPYCTDNPHSCICEFRRFLQVHAPDLGENANPICRDDLEDNSTSRQTLYWSARFFTESQVALIKRLREGLESETLNHSLSGYTNLRTNTVVFGAYDPAGSRSLINFTPALLGHRHAATAWTEDYLDDEEAETTSLYADILASAAATSQLGFGSYVVGANLGNHPWGASYKILSLIGHGAKVLSVYNWDSWKAYEPAYGPIAQALRQVGWGERLLYPGRRARGKVALLRSGSRLWDDRPALTHNAQEVYGLDFALRHAGNTVDFIDDEDIVSHDALEGRGYTTLYVTEANVSDAAVARIESWVSTRGGTVAVMPGAAIANEFNEPGNVLSTMNTLLGVTNRGPVLDVMPTNVAAVFPACGIPSTLPPSAPILNLDRSFGVESPAATQLSLSGPVTPIVRDATQPEILATIVATVESPDQPAVTAKAYPGNGQAIAYGFFPGWQYWISPVRTPLSGSTCVASCKQPCGIPQKWKPVPRDIAAAPAALAHTEKPVEVTSNGKPVAVEIDRLDSDGGIALVLLNWTFEPLSEVTVTVKHASRWRAVTSQVHDKVVGTVIGDDLQFEIPLKAVDVVLLEEGPPDCSSAEAPQCNGVCPSGSECRAPTPDGECVCSPIPVPPTCFSATAPQCNGECPTGYECESPVPDAECVCSPIWIEPPCSSAASPQCDGECPSGYECMAPAENAECVCRPIHAESPCSAGQCGVGEGCTDGVCSCRDGVQDFGEEAVDCGGPCEKCSCEKRGQCHLFVTSSQSSGKLGGLAGADLRCNDLASLAGLKGTYQAWLCDGTQGPATRSVKASVPYVRTDGVLIADNWADLTDGSIANSINVNESGHRIGLDGLLPWTNVLVSGACDNGPDCGGWTSSSWIRWGAKGDVNLTSSFWTDGVSGLCSVPFERFYCIEQ